MTWQWRKIGAVAGVFVAVAALALVLVALHRSPVVLQPATTSHPGGFGPGGFGTGGLAPIVRPGMKIVPMRVRPNPGECEEPEIPAGATVPPCP